jgi:TldD protein
MINKFLKSRIPDAKKLVEELNHSYEYVSVLGNYVKTKRIMVTTTSSSINELDNECGFVIKAYKEGHYSEYSCDDIRDIDVNKVVEEMSITTPYAASIPCLKEQEHIESYLREDTSNLDDEEIFNNLVEMKDYAHKKDERIIQVACAYTKRETSKIFVSNHKCLDQKYDWCNAMMVAVAREGENIQRNFSSEGEVNSSLVLEKLDKNKDNIIDICLKLLHAKPIVPGTYDIIADPAVAGLIAHEAFGHGVEMDMFVKERAKAVQYVGKPVASEVVNMYDGAASCLSAASYFFDDDGVEASKTNIIKNGILQTGISDCLSAMELGTTPTGNGRRESYKRKVYTRMTNTFFDKGNDKFDDMLKSIKHGYYICQSNNGMEDPKNWQIQCTAGYGLEIKDGKFTGEIVAPVVISGSVIDLLSSITMVSDELHIFGSGMCGKGHKEWVFVSDGGPHLKGRAKLS